MNDSDQWDAAEASVERARDRADQADEKAARGACTEPFCTFFDIQLDSWKPEGPTLSCVQCGWTCAFPGGLTVREALDLRAAHIAGGLF